MDNQKNIHHNDEQKITLGLIISWVLGSLSGLSGIVYLFSKPVAGLLYILIALILLPPVNKFMKEKYKFSLSGGLKFVVVLILLTIIGTSLTGGSVTGELINLEGSSSTSQKDTVNIEIADITTKVIEQNSIWWKYAWNLKLKNNTSKDKAVTAIIKWVDSEGFVIDSHTEYSLTIPANQEKTFNDFVLIDASTAGNVEKVEAEVSR